MAKRFLSIWFRHLKTDWLVRRQPALQQTPFVFAAPDHGRMIITAVNPLAEKEGIHAGMVLADARAILPCLQYFDDEEDRAEKLLNGLAEWLIRFSPVVALDAPEGLLLDISGCAHLWGGEEPYLTEIYKRLKNFGYHIRMSVADTIGTAWAIARFGKDCRIIAVGQQSKALLSLPPAALRLEPGITERLEKLGLRQVGQFMQMPKTALRRRFGINLLSRLAQALGTEEETIQAVHPVPLYCERLPCLEPIVTATGIEIALQRLLDMLCMHLRKEEKGLRKAVFTCYRVDNKIEEISIGTNRPSVNKTHLFKLFEDKISGIEPALGIELFILNAAVVEDFSPVQEKIWENTGGLTDNGLAELLDRLEGKFGAAPIKRYMPDEHYWPERSFKKAATLQEQPQSPWKKDRPRPIQLLPVPEKIEVTAPVPDYPPMNFRYKGILHKITKADGPERIEPEWWLKEGQHRDYYHVEDEAGCRYWLFRLGHYDSIGSYQWYIHGFFA